MLIKPRASVSSGVNSRTRGLSAADAQEALEKTALVSVFPRAGNCAYGVCDPAGKAWGMRLGQGGDAGVAVRPCHGQEPRGPRAVGPRTWSAAGGAVV